jgi:hypothetical protein
MAFGQRQVIHLGIEVAVASGTAVLGIYNDQVTGMSRKAIAQVVEGPFDRTQAVRTLSAQRTGASLVVAAAPYQSRFWQVLNTGNPLCFIGGIFARSKHLDNLQHRSHLHVGISALGHQIRQKYSVLLLQSQKNQNFGRIEKFFGS